eukprot:1941370-Amphidinium_carterae.2
MASVGADSQVRLWSSRNTLELQAEMLPKPPLGVGTHMRVVEYNDFARCLDQVCCRQTGKVKGKNNHEATC